LVSLGIALALLVVWEVLVRGQLISVFYFPAPSFIAKTFWRMLSDGTLIEHVQATLLRLLAGLLVGGLPGLLLGLAMGWSPKLRNVVDPFIAAVHPLPKIALLPLIMVIFGVGDTSLVIVAAAAAFFPMLINTVAGVRHINPIYFDVARNYRASRSKVFQRVVVPGSLPTILIGLRLAVNTTLLVTVAVEMVSAYQGLGAMIWMTWNTMRIEEIYVSLLVITLLGIVFTLSLQYLSTRLTPWHLERSG
jgi:NitT/TauT family transport system permease protein